MAHVSSVSINPITTLPWPPENFAGVNVVLYIKHDAMLGAKIRNYLQELGAVFVYFIYIYMIKWNNLVNNSASCVFVSRFDRVYCSIFYDSLFGFRMHETLMLDT